MHQFLLILIIDCAVFVPSYLLFSSFYPEFHIKGAMSAGEHALSGYANEMASDLEFLFQALALPALVPLPTGKKVHGKRRH